MNVAETVTKQVVVVSKSAELTVLLNRLLAQSNWYAAAASPGKAADSCSLADAMVVDLPLADRGAAVAEIRRRFSGPLIVITRHGEGWSGLSDEDQGIVLLGRPFAAKDLSAAVGSFTTSDGTSPHSAFGRMSTAAPAPPVAKDAAAWPGSPTTMAGSAAMTDGSASGNLAMVRSGTRTVRRGVSPTWWSRAASGLIASLGDRCHRRRLAVGAAASLVAFVGAFTLAAQGSCGPGCKDLTNSSRVQLTSVTIEAPGVTGSPGRQTTGSTAYPRASGPDDIRDGLGSLPGATLSAARRSGSGTTTIQSSDSGSASASPTTASPTTARPTTAPPTTAPPTTAPPTTAPPTTAPPTTAPPDDT